ncbi:MAG: hypothetical protein ACLUP5_03650 [Streptococcus sp.]
MKKKRKSFLRMVIVYKLNPKVLLKEVVEIFCLSFLIRFLSSHTIFGIDDISLAVFFESGIRPRGPTVFVKVVKFYHQSLSYGLPLTRFFTIFIKVELNTTSNEYDGLLGVALFLS